MSEGRKKEAKFRDRSTENAIEKWSFLLISWAISGELNNEQQEHKNMIWYALNITYV